jgi:predicted lipoprotein with Yx(FWY)xxD motif
MKFPTKQAPLLALAIGALALPACGDEEDGEEPSAGGGDAVVSVASVDGTDVLADAEGRSLYTADVEEDGEILCTRACATIWEPALGSAADAQAASDEVGAEIALVERPDGERQLALDGSPLYSFAEEGPGELTGDGFVDDFDGTTFTWSAATAPGSAEPESTDGAAPAGGGGGYGGY